ncbi:transporter substrate-binding domain-containing protein [Legionella longbeachae]|nr:transporter substrate-binding domain-containing protein [Legionella longbeachae]
MSYNLITKHYKSFLVRKSIILIICIIILPLNIYGRTLTVGISHFDPPFVIQLSPKHFSGFDIDLIQNICKKLNDDCTLISMDWDELIDAVAQKKVDIAVSGLTIPQSHSSPVAFSIPYLIMNIDTIGLKKNVIGHFNMRMLINANIGTTDKDYWTLFKKLNLKSTNFILFDQDDELINALKVGKIKFALVDSYTASYWEVNSSNTIKDLGPVTHLEYFTAIAINPNDPELQNEINKALTDYLHSKDFMDNYRNNLIHF